MEFIKIKNTKVIKLTFIQIRDLLISGNMDGKNLNKSGQVVGPVLPLCPFVIDRIMRTNNTKNNQCNLDISERSNKDPLEPVPMGT